MLCTHWVVTESWWDTLKLSEWMTYIPPAPPGWKKMLQAEHNSVFSDPYWESHIQALHSMASRQHLTWPTLPLFATQHSSCAWAANLRAWYAKAFAYTEITVAASAARSETIRSANCCYHGLLVPLAQVLLYTRWSKCSKITSPHGSPSSNSSACKSLSY